MYILNTTKQFEKDLRRCIKRGFPMEELRAVLSALIAEGKVAAKYKPHKLSGNHAGEWECHIKPDWLLIWEQNDTQLTLLMLNTGTHSDIFDK